MIVLRIMGFPIALIYGLIVRVRNYFYDTGIFKSRRYDTPTICVGNLSLGGTGKTPMVEFLVSVFAKSKKVAVLSRGYRRKSSGFVLANSESTVEQLGDEPFQMHRKFENLTLAVDANRGNGIELLVSKVKPDLIILDDAFQHRKVSPTFSILLTAFDKLYSDDFFFPTGTLRDSRSQAKRAHVIVVTKCPKNLSEDERKKMVFKLNPKPKQKVLFSYLEYEEEIKGSETTKTIDLLDQKNFTLVTGIASPVSLVAYLEQKGLQFEHLRFKDHHSFTKREIDGLRAKEFVLTTEKDFVRLQGKIERLAYIEISHKFIEGGESELTREIEKITKLNS